MSDKSKSPSNTDLNVPKGAGKTPSNTDLGGRPGDKTLAKSPSQNNMDNKDAANRQGAKDDMKSAQDKSKEAENKAKEAKDKTKEAGQKIDASGKPSDRSAK